MNSLNKLLLVNDLASAGRSELLSDSLAKGLVETGVTQLGVLSLLPLSFINPCQSWEVGCRPIPRPLTISLFRFLLRYFELDEKSIDGNIPHKPVLLTPYQLHQQSLQAERQSLRNPSLVRDLSVLPPFGSQSKVIKFRFLGCFPIFIHNGEGHALLSD